MADALKEVVEDITKDVNTFRRDTREECNRKETPQTVCQYCVVILTQIAHNDALLDVLTTNEQTNNNLIISLNGKSQSKGGN